jgi:hypothetical protein
MGGTLQHIMQVPQVLPGTAWGDVDNSMSKGSSGD